MGAVLVDEVEARGPFEQEQARPDLADEAQGRQPRRQDRPLVVPVRGRLAERAIGTALGELVRAALGQRPLLLGGNSATGLAALDLPTELAETPVDWDDEGPILTPGLPLLRLVGQ